MSVSQPIKSYQMEIKPISFKASLSLNKVIFNPNKMFKGSLPIRSCSLKVEA